MLRTRPIQLVFASLCGAAALLGGCTSEDAERPSAETTDAGVDPNAHVDCASTRFGGSTNKMVEVATPSGRRYCIDEHEVTRGQYKNFVGLAGSDTGLQGPNCINAGVDNQPKWPTSEGGGETGSWDPPDAPMNYVHYCGASAYCHWAGKKLCGAVGDGKQTYELVTDSNHTFIKDADVVLANLEGDQWYNACTQGGKTAQGTAHPGTCATSIDALVSESCPGDIEPFTRVYGLYGGVAEITDICGSAGCVVRASGSQDCVDSGLVINSLAARDMGFRCCAD